MVDPSSEVGNINELGTSHSANQAIKNNEIRDFPGGPVVKTPHLQCRGPGSDPWLGN